VGAPTFITATPPVSFANLSCSFSLSNSLSVSFICFLICSILAFILVVSPFPPIIVVFSLVTFTFSALPKYSKDLMFSNFIPNSSLITSPPVNIAISPKPVLILKPVPILKPLPIPKPPPIPKPLPIPKPCPINPPNQFRKFSY